MTGATMQGEWANMSPEHEMLREMYRDFNARRVDAVLERMHPDVAWANGMEGGHVHGREAVRAYWTRQFESLNPQVEPQKIERSADGQWVVTVHQVVSDLNGNLLLDTVVYHRYQILDGLIVRMDIAHKQAQDGQNE
jgi:hypothetical protein